MPDIMRHGKKPLDSGANLYHITLGLGLRLRVAPPYFAICVRLTRRLFNAGSNSFVTTAALTEVCALLSVILFVCLCVTTISLLW